MLCVKEMEELEPALYTDTWKMNATSVKTVLSNAGTLQRTSKNMNLAKTVLVTKKRARNIMFSGENS